MRLRRYAVAGVGVAAIVLIIAVAVVSRSADDALAELRIRTGKVALERGSAAAALATEGEDLRAGDVVLTDNVGQARIDLFDGSVLRLDASSQIGLRQLDDRDGRRSIEVQTTRGRVWHRVEDGVSGRFVTDVGAATITATGTTYMTDCRREPTCYVVMFGGEANAADEGGRDIDLEDGDCIEVTGGKLTKCDESDLGLIDDWVRENLAEDEALALERRAAATATPSPSATSTIGRPNAPPVVRAPVATTAAPTSTPEPTPEPTRFPDFRTFPPMRTMPPTSAPDETAEPTTDPDDDRTPRPTP